MAARSKVVLVTGGGRGIGRATAELFAAQGGVVGVLERDAGAIAWAEGAQGEIQPLVGDAGSREHVFAAARRLRDQYGHLDVIVANAMSAKYGPVTEVGEADLDAMLRVGLKQVFWAAQAGAEFMDPDRGGVIVNMASPVAFVGVAGTSVYTAAKGAVVALTRQLAVELGPKIRVVAVMPGAVATEGAASIGAPERNDRRVAVTPLRRRGTPLDIAQAVAFAASDEAAFITGAVLPVDGGITIAGH